MKFLLDTTVVSEWAKSRPDEGVVAWLAAADEDCIFISVVTLAELRHGIQRLPPGTRRNRLDKWLRNELPMRFEGRVLPIEVAVADAWGRIVARCEAAGRPVGAMDALIAATADVCGLTLVTRNVSDFEPSLKAIINPWTGN
jgi:predicted nucleic acid-binding protein